MELGGRPTGETPPLPGEFSLDWSLETLFIPILQIRATDFYPSAYDPSPCQGEDGWGQRCSRALGI